MEQVYDISMRLLAALAIGLLIGIERGWSGRAEDEGDRVAGIRTFSLLGLMGGVWALIAQDTNHWLLGAAFLGVAALTIASHVVDVRSREDVGATTQVAMLLTFSLAAWSAYGQQISALAVTVVSVALLGYKPVLHRWLSRVQQFEFYAGIKLLIISVVLLPLLPDRGFGPWQALNPYWIWWMVVLISGLSFIGYIAIQLTGKRLGTLVTAIAGGLASSTAVTLSLARFAKQTGTRTIFFSGVLVASSIMFIRVLIEVSVVNARLLSPLWLPLSVIFAGMLIAAIVTWYIGDDESSSAEEEIDLASPLKLSMAVKFGILLTAILLLSRGMEAWFGSSGVYAVAIASGVMDVDAIVLSLSRMAINDLTLDVAALGIILAATTNTLIKGVIFSAIVGVRKSLRLFLLLILALIPGLLIAIVLA